MYNRLCFILHPMTCNWHSWYHCHCVCWIENQNYFWSRLAQLVMGEGGGNRRAKVMVFAALFKHFLSSAATDRCYNFEMCLCLNFRLPFQLVHQTICLRKLWPGFSRVPVDKTASLKTPTGGQSVSVLTRCSMDELHSLTTAPDLWSSPTLTSWIIRYIYAAAYCSLFVAVSLLIHPLVLHGFRPHAVSVTQQLEKIHWKRCTSEIIFFAVLCYNTF